MTEQSGVCKCESGRVQNAKNGQCEALDVTFKASSVDQGTCSVRTTLPAHYWGTYRPDDTKCSEGQSCEPALGGYSCLSAINKLDTVCCGTAEKMSTGCVGQSISSAKRVILAQDLEGISFALKIRRPK